MKKLTRGMATLVVAYVVFHGSTYARPPDVETEMLRLRSSQSGERATAARMLGNIGDPIAVSPLIAALEDEDPHVRQNAVAALRWIRDARAVDPLILALQDEDEEVREAAVGALGTFKDPRAAGPLIAVFRTWPSTSSVGASLESLGKPALEPLRAALKDDAPAVRVMAASTLGRIRETGAVEPLISALKDENREVRQAAVNALRWIRDTRAVEPLSLVLQDEDRDVRESTVQALGQFGDPRATEPLIAAFRVWPMTSSVGGALKRIGAPAVEPLCGALTDNNPAVRTMAADTLGRIRDTAATPPLIRALQDEDGDVRRTVVTALRYIRDERAVEPLILVLQDENGDVRESTVQALGQFGDPRAAGPLIAVFRMWPETASVGRSLERIGAPAVEPLCTALRDGRTAVRMMAADTLGRIRDTAATEPLVLALQDENGDVRRKVVTALRWIRDDRAVAPLIVALRDKDPDVRAAAASALKSIVGKDLGKDSEEWSQWWEENREAFPGEETGSQIR